MHSSGFELGQEVWVPVKDGPMRLEFRVGGLGLRVSGFCIALMGWMHIRSLGILVSVYMECLCWGTNGFLYLIFLASKVSTHGPLVSFLVTATANTILVGCMATLDDPSIGISSPVICGCAGSLFKCSSTVVRFGAVISLRHHVQLFGQRRFSMSRTQLHSSVVP